MGEVTRQAAEPNTKRKHDERDVREQIQRGAADERQHLQRVGARDPGQEKAERVWRESWERHERQQRDKQR